ncbi:MAG: DUF58 domain-containing protein [Luteimonas sp.]
MTVLTALRKRFESWARSRQPESLPVRFDRRRIYVLPTGFGWFFAALLLAMGIGALNYNNNPALLLCVLLAGAANASLFTAHLQLSGLQIAAAAADPVPAGTPLQLRVHARAKPGRERRGLQVKCGPARAVLSLEAGSGEADLAIATAHRGWLELERLMISTTRPLGLGRAWAYAWPDLPLLVYPAPEMHGPALPVGTGNSAHARMQPAGDDVHHLRAYRRGDARSAIAWKPSARRDALLVRAYEQPLGADVLLDWHQLSGLAYEARIQRLARWIDEAEREGRRYALALPGQPVIGAASGLLHRHVCLKALALMPHATAD